MKAGNKYYTLPIIFSILFILGSSYKTYLNGDEVEYVSIAKAIINGEGIDLFGKPTTIAFTWSVLISPLFANLFDIKTSIILCRILSLLLIIISAFQVTFILRNISINNTKLSDDKIFIIQLLTFGNLYYWQQTGSLFLEPFSLVVFLFICMIIVKDSFDFKTLVLLGILSATLAATKYVAIVIYPALLIHFVNKYGLTKKFYSSVSIIFISSFILLVPVFLRFINLEFFTQTSTNFSYLEKYNAELEKSSPAMALLVQLKNGTFIFFNRFHEYFTTFPKLNAPYLSLLIIIPLLIFFYKNIRTRFTFTFYCSFTILFSLALMGSGFGGSTRYWIIIFPLCIIFLVEEVSGWKFFERSFTVSNKFLQKALPVVIAMISVVIIAALFYLRNSGLDLLAYKYYSLILSLVFTISVVLLLVLKRKNIYLWQATALLLFVLPFSRALNEFIILGRPEPVLTAKIADDQFEVCEFLDSQKFDSPLIQNTDSKNAAWSTAYSSQPIKDYRIDYELTNLKKIYFISKATHNHSALKISGKDYIIKNTKTLFSNSQYKVLEFELSN